MEKDLIFFKKEGEEGGLFLFLMEWQVLVIGIDFVLVGIYCM